MDQRTIIVLIVGAVALIALGWLLPRGMHRRNRENLRQRFGPEYERAVETYGSASRAERELAARAKRVQRFQLKDLTGEERSRFGMAWDRVQARFVDEPLHAVQEANELIKDIMKARGYPEADYEQRVADLSVHHPDVVQHYRAARTLAQDNPPDHPERQNTEELRQAVIHFRALFAELMEGPTDLPHHALEQAHA